MPDIAALQAAMEAEFDEWLDAYGEAWGAELEKEFESEEQKEEPAEEEEFALPTDKAKLAKAAAYLLNPEMIEKAPQRIVKTETVVRNKLGLIERIERTEEAGG